MEYERGASETLSWHRQKNKDDNRWHLIMNLFSYLFISRRFLHFLLKVFFSFIICIVIEALIGEKSSRQYLITILEVIIMIYWGFALIGFICGSFIRLKDEEKARKAKITDGLDVKIDVKICPFCAEEIKINARICKYCRKKIGRSKLVPIIIIIFLLILFIIPPEKIFPKTEQVANTNAQITNCSEKETTQDVMNATTLVGGFDKKDRFISYGTGFALKSPDEDLILTNYHVIDGVVPKVWGDDGSWHKVKIWASYPDEDIALLQTDYKLSNTLELIDSDNILETDTLYAIGWPNEPSGYATVTKGILSRRINDGDREILQTDASINKGNSGGPLINDCGVIGMNTAKIFWSDKNTPSEGIGYALSSNFIKKIIYKK